jgi:four helix bundle protein
MKKLRYKNWVKEVPDEITNDSLWNMKVYRHALFLADVAWEDIQQLSKNKLLLGACDQLFRSAGLVSANTSEGYSKKSKRDQARFYEYALGSARECRGWYYKVRHNLDENILNSRLKLIPEIIKMLLHIVPRQQGKKIKEPEVEYLAQENGKSELIENIEIPFPDQVIRNTNDAIRTAHDKINPQYKLRNIPNHVFKRRPTISQKDSALQL